MEEEGTRVRGTSADSGLREGKQLEVPGKSLCGNAVWTMVIGIQAGTVQWKEVEGVEKTRKGKNPGGLTMVDAMRKRESIQGGLADLGSNRLHEKKQLQRVV